MTYISSLVVCSGEGCPVAAQCIRHIKYLTEKDSELILQLLNLNLVTITSDGCEHVHIARTVTLARGFKAIYDTVPRGEAKNLWHGFPGSTSRRDFYRLLSGEKPLTPEQQEKVLNHFETLGANIALGFDHYEEATI